MHEFRVLGPLEVWHQGRSLGLNASMMRRILVTLLCHANRPVSAQALADSIWDGRPPPSAKKNIQGYVMRLRRQLGESERIRLTPGGYSIALAPGELDADEFTDLLGRAFTAKQADQLTEAGRLFGDALKLWRGPTACVDAAGTALVATSASRLEEQRLAAIEASAEVDLLLGQHGELISALAPVMDEHPFHERFREHMMLALFRNGRQADALELYRRTHALMVGELGVEPGPRLQAMHASILRSDPDLWRATATSGASSVASGQTETIQPRQLPADVAGFTGRDEQLDALSRLEKQGDDLGLLVITAVGGSAGVGKTALAVHWAHHVADRFPDGQLYVDLQGYSSAPPVNPAEALAGMLRSLNVRPERIPMDTREAAALYRTILSDRRVLVLLDNARSVEQVRPLLPGGPGCLVLVTSRERLAGLVAREGAHSLTLDVMSPAEAELLLERTIGRQRVRAEPEAAARIARLCAYLPLALRVAAARVAEDPHRKLETLARELEGAGRLDALAVGGDDRSAVRVAFDLSYRALDVAAQRLFRLLGVVPGNSFTAEVVAALAGLTPADASRGLTRLAHAHLISRVEGDRYGFHDLMRDYAQGYAAADEEREAAGDRLYAWYEAAVESAGESILRRSMRLPRRAQPHPVPEKMSFPGSKEAIAWLDTELSGLVAAVRRAAETGRAETAWRLADGLSPYFHRRGNLTEWFAVTGAALTAATAEGDLFAQAAIHISLSGAYSRQSDFRQEIASLRKAHRLSVECGWRECELGSQINLAFACYLAGSLHQACDLLSTLEDQVRRAKHRGLLNHLVILSHVLLDMGRADEAMAKVTEAFDHQTTVHTECLVRHALGQVHHHFGRLDEALRELNRAVAIQAELGDNESESWILVTVSAVHRDAGRFAEALSSAQRAVALSAHDDVALYVKAYAAYATAASHRCLGNLDLASNLARSALEMAQRSGCRRVEIASLVEVAMILRLQDDDSGVALSLARQALELARDGGFAPLSEAATKLIEP